jgi:hypothetical protein
MTEERESYLSNEEVEIYCKKYLETWSKVTAYLTVHPESTRESALHNITRYHSNPKVIEYLKAMILDKVMGTDEIYSTLSYLARDNTNKQTQLRALELIGKTHGLFVDRTDITSKGDKLSWGEYLEKINQETNKESS